jgi:cytosylglucuronate decarboxylase
MLGSTRRRYLFIRLLEACNADCFMCGYALSRDRYRFSAEEFDQILPQARALGVAFVRFTGGEPLLHKDIIGLVKAGTAVGMMMSIITNGQLLPRMIDRLASAGLAQVVVSVDGSTAKTHDAYRNTPGLFEACVAGLRLARERGVRTRVNTVVGPHNFVEMPELQRVLTGLRVQQWELSAIKLERHIVYPAPDDVRAVCDPIYAADPTTMLVPMGKRFYGDIPAEQTLFFETGVTPRPSPPCCNLIGDVIYLDAKEGVGFGCSLLPHRTTAESGGGVPMRTDSGWVLDAPGFREQVEHFRAMGPFHCRSCSTTAAGYSDDVSRSQPVGDWLF